MAAPLWKEWASSEFFGMRFQRCPNINEHILSGSLDALLNSRRDTPRVLANNIEAAQNPLPQLILFTRNRRKNRNLSNHALQFLLFHYTITPLWTSTPVARGRTLLDIRSNNLAVIHCLNRS